MKISGRTEIKWSLQTPLKKEKRMISLCSYMFQKDRYLFPCLDRTL